MSLDLGQTVLQIDAAAHAISQEIDDRHVRLTQLLEQAQTIPASEAITKTQNSMNRPYMAAQIKEDLIGSKLSNPYNGNWSTLSVDGSHIDVDRHLPIPCYLINMGGCIFSYGDHPSAEFFSAPSLAVNQQDLYLKDDANENNEELISGPLLGIIRSVQEIEHLVDKVSECSTDQPLLALVDGTLVLWGLSGQGYRPFVRNTILRDRFLPALEKLRQIAENRVITLAAYVSLPRTTEVANAIRCSLCPFDALACQESCSHHRSRRSPCDQANGFMDRELFQEVLEPYARSPVYRTNPSAAQEYYGEHQVYFYYLHSGNEIARVEIPQWVASNEELLDLGHSLIVEQCKKGQGYPVAISEAHEQAVISGSDRQLFHNMVQEALERQGLASYTSEKERSKSRPWL
jgi:hypothetical protein